MRLGVVRRRLAAFARDRFRARGLHFVGVAVCVVAVAYFSWHRLYAGKAETATMRVDGLRTLEQQNAELKSELTVLERQLQVERASQADIAKQLKSLSEENARLRDDMALLQAVAGAGGAKGGIRLSSVRVEPAGDTGEYNYRMVLLQTGARGKPFYGSYQLLVHVDQDGLRRGVMLPGTSPKAEPPFQLEFTVQQRIEGTFRVAPNAVVRSVQVRIFEAGHAQPKLMQTVTLS